jgi:hypothetical protein
LADLDLGASLDEIVFLQSEDLFDLVEFLRLDDEILPEGAYLFLGILSPPWAAP